MKLITLRLHDLFSMIPRRYWISIASLEFTHLCDAGEKGADEDVG